MRSGDVTPRLAAFDCGDGREGDAIAVGDVRLTERGAAAFSSRPHRAKLPKERLYFRHDGSRQARTVDRFSTPKPLRMPPCAIGITARRTLGHRVPPMRQPLRLAVLRGAVRHIVIVGAGPQVALVAAGRIVARVADELPIGQWTPEEEIDEVGHLPLFAGDDDNSVGATPTTRSAIVGPALIGGAAPNAGENVSQSFRGRQERERLCEIHHWRRAR